MFCKFAKPVLQVFTITVKVFSSYFTLCFCLSANCCFAVIQSESSGKDSNLVHIKTISGDLSPKSIVHNGKGLFFAQNMMYRHTISVFNQQYQLVKRIKDNINPSDFGFSQYNENLKGAPVECAFSSDGKFAFVSNYAMEGEHFTRPGCDECSGKDYDKSFIYKINTSTLQIESIIESGSVPKFLAVSPNDKYLLVSNWSSANVSLIDLQSEKEIKKFSCGRFPRGIAIDPPGHFAYIAIMGGYQLMRIDLEELTIAPFLEVGRGPRHLCIDPENKFIYVSLNHESNIAKINLSTLQEEKLFVGGTPRSMTLDKSGKRLYVVNYSSNKMTKINTETFTIDETVSTRQSPIGITYNENNHEIWVACYSGSIMVFKDKETLPEANAISFAVVEDALQSLYNSTMKIIPIDGKTNVPAEEKTLPDDENLVLNETDKPVETKTENRSKTAGDFFIIVGSFKDINNARRQVKKLNSQGYTATMIDNPNGFHYAAIGSYLSKDDATMNISQGMKQEYPGAWVYQQK